MSHFVMPESVKKQLEKQFPKRPTGPKIELFWFAFRLVAILSIGLLPSLAIVSLWSMLVPGGFWQTLAMFGTTAITALFQIPMGMDMFRQLFRLAKDFGDWRRNYYCPL